MSRIAGPAIVVISAFLLILPLGCESTQTSSFQWVDSAGVQIMKIPADFQAPEVQLYSAVPEIITGNEDDPIGNLRGLAWLDRNRAALADDDMTVRIYDRGGSRLAMIGQRGAGPGEFQDILWMARSDGGGFGVFDPMANRLSLFDSSGVLQRAVSPQARIRGFPNWVGHLMDDDLLIGSTFPAEPDGGRIDPPALWGYSPIIAYSPEDNGVANIDRVALIRCKEGSSERCVPDGWSGAVATGGGEVYVAPLDWPEIRVYSSVGALRRVFRFLDPGSGGFAQMIIDHQGRIWVSRESETFWTMINSQEPSVKRFIFPEQFRLRDVWESTFLGVEIDELRVQRVATIAF